MPKAVKKPPLQRRVARKPVVTAVAVEPQSYTVTLSPDLFTRLTSFAASRGIDVESFIRVATTTVMRASRYYDLDTVISFGKFSGERMETIIRLDPGYIVWAVEHVTGMCLSENAQKLLDHMIDRASENDGTEIPF